MYNIAFVGLCGHLRSTLVEDFLSQLPGQLLFFRSKCGETSDAVDGRTSTVWGVSQVRQH